MTDSAAFKRLPDPPFYRGDKGEWDAPYCDRILDTTGNACDDEDPAYLIEWKPTSRDGGTTPISGACERHALDVDRRQVVRICTHPRKAVAS